MFDIPSWLSPTFQTLLPHMYDYWKFGPHFKIGKSLYTKVTNMEPPLYVMFLIWGQFFRVFVKNVNFEYFFCNFVLPIIQYPIKYSIKVPEYFLQFMF